MRKNISTILLVFLLGIVSLNVLAQQKVFQEESTVCAVYITGIGCGNCAVTDSIILYDLPVQYNNFVVIEYEIYKSAAANQEVSAKYFKNYLSGTRPGVPFFILNKDTKALGRMQVAKAKELLEKKETNSCSLPSGENKDFKNLDLSSLPGKVKIWHKDRVLIKEEKNAKTKGIKELLVSADIGSALEGREYQKIEPKKVSISKGEIFFKNAVQVEGWLFQWGQKSINKKKLSHKKPQTLSEIKLPPFIENLFNKRVNFLTKKIKIRNIIIIGQFLFILILLFLLFRKKIKLSNLARNKKLKNGALILLSLGAVALIFILAKNISADFFKDLRGKIPFPLFTFLIAFVDGFNPCNLFVLTLLLALLISVSGSRKKIYIVGFTFIFVVFLFYFLFMVAWLNIFKYFSFFTYVRIIIGAIAILAGLINCKDYFFFKKGISLTIGKKQKGVLVKKMDRVRKIIGGGSLLMLILSSLGLAIFSSLVELPCTAGFPIIFTTILASKAAIATSSYYLWILLYNLIYILPLAVIVAIFGYTFRAKRISQKQIEIIKLIGGIIMVALGLILIINPQFVGIALK